MQSNQKKRKRSHYLRKPETQTETGLIVNGSQSMKILWHFCSYNRTCFLFVIVLIKYCDIVGGLITRFSEGFVIND